MLRTAFAVLALLTSPLVVQAQGQAQPQPQQPPQQAPAPDQHPGTGLVFPAQIANVPKVRSADYGKMVNQPGLGFSWGYQSGQVFLATAYLYNLGINSIPDGPSSQPVAAQFETALKEIREAAAARKYEQLKIANGPADCTAGRLTFRCITMTGMRNSRPLHTGLMVAGYRNYFFKLRLDWFDDSDFNQAAVDRFVQTLVGTVVR